jgi:hypothetical protein
VFLSSFSFTSLWLCPEKALPSRLSERFSLARSRFLRCRSCIAQLLLIDTALCTLPVTLATGRAVAAARRAMRASCVDPKFIALQLSEPGQREGESSSLCGLLLSALRFASVLPLAAHADTAAAAVALISYTAASALETAVCMPLRVCVCVCVCV